MRVQHLLRQRVPPVFQRYKFGQRDHRHISHEHIQELHRACYPQSRYQYQAYSHVQDLRIVQKEGRAQ